MGSVERFRKKPVVIDAMQFFNDGSSYDLLHWINEGQHAAGREFATWQNNTIMVPTLEGQHIASPGDWIIRGVQGEFYPCKPDIFAETYEPEDAAALREQPEASYKLAAEYVAMLLQRAARRIMSKSPRVADDLLGYRTILLLGLTAEQQPEARGVVSASKTRITLHQDRAGCEWIIVTNDDYPDFESEVTPDDDPALFAFLKDLTAAQQPEDLKAWSQRMAGKEQGQHVSAGSHGIEDKPVQEGGGEVAAWMTPESIAHLAKQNGVAKVDAWNCASGTERVPVYTAPPSAPVGVEDKARAMFEAQADNLAAPWDRQWEPTKDFWRKCAAEALTQQPAQAATGWKLVPEKITTEMWKAWEISNMASESYQEDYAAMLAAAPTPPGDDAAEGGS